MCPRGHIYIITRVFLCQWLSEKFYKFFSAETISSMYICKTIDFGRGICYTIHKAANSIFIDCLCRLCSDPHTRDSVLLSLFLCAYLSFPY